MKNMKKFSFIWIAVLFAAGFSAAPVFSQDAAAAAGPVDNSEFYVLQVPIEKIYVNPKGYYVEYRKNGFEKNSIILPRTWFVRTPETTSALKGEVVKISNAKYSPHLAIYYKDGKTDHIKLFVREDNHKTWGKRLPSSVNFDDVDNIEEIIIAR
jgi:hypothetical protein